MASMTEEALGETYGNTNLEEQGRVRGDLGGTTSQPIGILRLAEEPTDLSPLHGGHTDVPGLDHLT